MKLIAASIGFLVVGATIWMNLGSHRPAAPLAPREPRAHRSANRDEQVARLTGQIEGSQRTPCPP